MGFMAAYYLCRPVLTSLGWTCADSWPSPDLKYNYAGVPKSKLPTYDTAAADFSVWLTMLLYSPILGLVKSSTLVFMLKIAGHIKNIKWSIHVR